MIIRIRPSLILSPDVLPLSFEPNLSQFVSNLWMVHNKFISSCTHLPLTPDSEMLNIWNEHHVDNYWFVTWAFRSKLEKKVMMSKRTLFLLLMVMFLKGPSDGHHISWSNKRDSCWLIWRPDSLMIKWRREMRRETIKNVNQCWCCFFLSYQIIVISSKMFCSFGSSYQTSINTSSTSIRIISCLIQVSLGWVQLWHVIRKLF